MHKRKTYRPWQPELAALLPSAPSEWLQYDPHVYFSWNRRTVIKDARGFSEGVAVEVQMIQAAGAGCSGGLRVHECVLWRDPQPQMAAKAAATAVWL
jgi:hypothetical protein